MIYFIVRYSYKNELLSQRQGKLRERRIVDETGQVVEEHAEDPDDAVIGERLECFERTSATSACPNAAKGKFVNLEEARDFLDPL